MKSGKLSIILGTSLVLLFLLQCQGLAHSWMSPEDEAEKVNPIPQSEESVNNGQTIFTDLCSSCHGAGAVGLSREKTGLKTGTPNLPDRLKTHSDGDFHWKILNGKNEMPPFTDELSEKEIWDVINYIRSLSK